MLKKTLIRVAIGCVFVVILDMLGALPVLCAGEKDVLDNAIHWETIAAPKKFKNHLFSSYDRTGANFDYGNFYGSDDEGWHILADFEGAGCVSRFMASYTDPETLRIRIYVDDLDVPVVEAPFLTSFPPFVYPLAEYIGDSWCSYLPILFRERFRLTIGPPGEDIDIYYHVNIIAFDDNVGVTPFTMPPNAEYQQKLDSLSSLLQTTYAPPWAPADSLRFDTSLTIGANSTTEVANISGEGTVFRFEVASFPMNGERARALILNVSYDNDTLPRIEAPLSDLISTGCDTVVRFSSLGFSYQDNRMAFYFPMPFKQGISLKLANTSSNNIPIEVAVAWTPTEIYTTRLCAVSKVDGDHISRVPMTLVDLYETGHLVAFMLTSEAEDEIVLLNGDEIIQVDGGVSPLWNGTEVTNYFNFGYNYGGGRAKRGYFGVPYYRRVGTPGCHAAYRIHALDYVAFSDHITFLMEHGGHSEFAGTFRTVMLYYGQLGGWDFEDGTGNGKLHAGETFRVRGWLLEPNSPLEFNLGGIVLSDLAGQATPEGTYEGIGTCPSLPDGHYLFQVSVAGDVDTIKANVSIDSDLIYSIENLRRDPMLFPYDTLEVLAFPIPSLAGTEIYLNELWVDWLPGTPTLDSLFVLRGRAQVPVVLPNGLVVVTLQTSVGSLRDTFSLSRQIRWEAERSIPPVAYRPRYGTRYSDTYREDLALELRSAAIGDSITLAIPVNQSGGYALRLLIEKRSNRGIMDVLWDNIVRVSGYDCYDTATVLTAVNLGTWTIEGGTHLLTLKVVGKHDSSFDYRLVADQLILIGTTFSDAEPEPDGTPIPSASFLEPCYPNPFNSTAVFRYGISRSGPVRLIVYNILGQRVMTLVDRPHKAGVYKATLNASYLASGLYFCRLQTGTFHQTRKLLLLK